jgi:predicted neutral ceramidase superfamily lipid hydrolase
MDFREQLAKRVEELGVAVEHSSASHHAILGRYLEAKQALANLDMNIEIQKGVAEATAKAEAELAAEAAEAVVECEPVLADGENAPSCESLN